MSGAEAVETARELADRGRYVDALQTLRPALRQLRAADDVEGLVLAWRICGRLGLHGHARMFARQLRRLGDTNLRALCCEQFDRLMRGHHLQVLERVRQPAPASPSPRATMQWQLLQARLWAELRDFEAAEAALQQAREVGADPETVLAENIWLLQARDQKQPALQACREARQRFPDDVGLLELEVWLLFEFGDAQAMAAMQSLLQTVQSPTVLGALSELRFERGDPAGARDGLERLLREFPLERRRRAHLHLGLVRICRTLGDDRAALQHAAAAGAAGQAWHRRLQQALAGELQATRRLVREVPFVRQDHLTCSPATMASLLLYHGVQRDQAEIAAQITYDGTASHRELQWAAEHDLAMWFFQFDAAVARRLIDLDLPFAISTRYETSGHRQALVGYDEVLETFVLRDPGAKLRPEYSAEWLQQHSRVRGGDCALILPRQLAARVPQDLLPQHDSTMQLLRMRAAFEARRLDEAEALGRQLLALPPCSLRREVELRLCLEHGDQQGALRAWQEAQRQHPDDGYWAFHLALELQQQGRWQQHRQFLEQQLTRTRSPFLLLQLADDLRHHALRRPEAEQLLRQVARRLPRHAGAMCNLARVLWADPTRRELASACYRAAACLDRHDEGLAGEYFDACRNLGAAERGLAFLRTRAERFGRQSAAPAVTLARALEQLHRTDEALSVLGRRCSRRTRRPPRGSCSSCCSSTGCSTRRRRCSARRTASTRRTCTARATGWRAPGAARTKPCRR